MSHHQDATLSQKLKQVFTYITDNVRQQHSPIKHHSNLIAISPTTASERILAYALPNSNRIFLINIHQLNSSTAFSSQSIRSFVSEINCHPVLPVDLQPVQLSFNEDAAGLIVQGKKSVHMIVLHSQFSRNDDDEYSSVLPFKIQTCR
jgi:hypothetical protein